MTDYERYVAPLKGALEYFDSFLRGKYFNPFYAEEIRLSLKSEIDMIEERIIDRGDETEIQAMRKDQEDRARKSQESKSC